MAGDYIPGNDNNFLAWANNFVSYIQAHGADFNSTTSEFTFHFLFSLVIVFSVCFLGAKPWKIHTPTTQWLSS